MKYRALVAGSYIPDVPVQCTQVTVPHIQGDKKISNFRNDLNNIDDANIKISGMHAFVIYFIFLIL